MRVLLSHNFAIEAENSGTSPLTREAFFQVFAAGLQPYESLQCRLLAHSHWIVEIVDVGEIVTPAQLGALCADALRQYRQAHNEGGYVSEILVLGGLKTTPATSTAKDALQPGEWGVDVVETESGTAFLEAMQWQAMVAQKSEDSVFKVMLPT